MINGTLISKKQFIKPEITVNFEPHSQSPKSDISRIDCMAIMTVFQSNAFKYLDKECEFGLVSNTGTFTATHVSNEINFGNINYSKLLLLGL